MSTREDGQLVVATGKSRSGKSAWVKQQLEKLLNKLGRVVVFDIKGEYSEAMGYRQVSGLHDLADLLQKSTGDLMVAYQPLNPKKEFGLWAKMVFTWGKMKPCVAVAEEIADVTSPGKAPDGWGQLCRQGLGFGIWIFAITQRPSESDKTAMGNASVIHCCQMARAKDRQYMAEELDVELSRLTALRADKKAEIFTYIEKDMGSGEVIDGQLTFG